jgi:hypothetical protein
VKDLTSDRRFGFRSRWPWSRATAAVGSLALHSAVLVLSWNWSAVPAGQQEPATEGSSRSVLVAVQLMGPNLAQSRPIDLAAVTQTSPFLQEARAATTPAAGLGWQFPQPEIVLPVASVRVRLFATWRNGSGWSDIEAYIEDVEGVDRALLEDSATYALAFGPTAPDRVLRPPKGYCFTITFSADGAPATVVPELATQLQTRERCFDSPLPGGAS